MFTNDNNYKEFEKRLNAVSESKDTNRVFEDFLTMAYTQFCFPDCEISNKMHMNAMQHYNEKEKKRMSECFLLMLKAYQSGINRNSWFDLPGHYLENNLHSKWKAEKLGQFFTPPHICDLMTQMIQPISNTNDPTAGSGRIILSAHARYPGNYHTAEELDLIAVKMCLINFLVHGVVGKIIWHNALTEPNHYRYLFVVNERLNKGLPIPHYKVFENVNLKDEISNPSRKSKIFKSDDEQLSLF